MKIKVAILILFVLSLIAPSVRAADTTATTEPSAKEENEDATELNKKLTNPVTDIWSISFQQNNYDLQTIPGQGERWSSNLQFQPVLPVSLTKEWNLITRPVIPLFVTQPHPDVEAGTPPQVNLETTTGFGDTILLEMLSPAPSIAGNWLLGVGPTFIFPTASTDFTGQGKWQVGPSVVVGYLSKKYILGFFVQNWTSFAGDSSRPRPNVNQMNLQPIAAYFLPGGWSIGYSGNILANWKADENNAWTVPLGLNVGKVFKFGILPVKISVAGQYMPIHPDTFGQKWNIQVQFTPVIPKLIKGALFD